MAEPMGATPENRLEADPFTRMTQACESPINYALANNDDDPHPQITKACYESDAGTWAGSRPDRARANNARYGNGSSETATPVIPEPCAEGHTAASGGNAEVRPAVNIKWYER